MFSHFQVFFLCPAAFKKSLNVLFEDLLNASSEPPFNRTVMCSVSGLPEMSLFEVAPLTWLADCLAQVVRVTLASWLQLPQTLTVWMEGSPSNTFSHLLILFARQIFGSVEEERQLLLPRLCGSVTFLSSATLPDSFIRHPPLLLTSRGALWAQWAWITIGAWLLSFGKCVCHLTWLH